MSRLPEPRANHIYGLSCTCHPERGYRYIGLTSQGAQRRLWGHRKSARRGKAWPVYSWMRKHGDTNVISTVLEELETPEELAAAEMRWIAHFRERAQADLNMTDGGEGTFGWVMPEEIRLAHSARLKAEYASGLRTHAPLTDEGRARMSAAARARMSDPDYAAEHARKVKEKWAKNPEMLARARENMSPLTPDDVADIRAMYDAMDDITHSDIGELYGVSSVTIGQIIRYERWADSAGRPKVQRPARKRRLSAERREAVKASRSRGEEHGKAVLSEASAKEIARRLWDGEKIDTIVPDYPVSRSAVAHISTGRSWEFLEWPIGPRRKPGSLSPSTHRVGANNWAARLTEDDVREIRRRYDAGETAKQIQADYEGISYPCIYSAATRKTWKHVPD